jgi:hypothetical protein
MLTTAAGTVAMFSSGPEREPRIQSLKCLCCLQDVNRSPRATAIAVQTIISPSILQQTHAGVWAGVPVDCDSCYLNLC